MRVAYLTSQYPGPSHTFIRREVSALRALGMTIDTFSVRVAPAEELVSEDDRQEAATTVTLLGRPLTDYLAAHLRELVRSPLRYAGTFGLALRHRAPGLKSGLLAVAHFGEAMLLASELRRLGSDHLHNHFGNSGATVGLLACHQARVGWSFTIHGISEFDYPAGLLLPAKIAAARFVACVSYFGRAQAYRSVSQDLWPKLTIVRCGLELDRLPHPTSGTADEVRLIFVGRLSAEKGLGGLIQALSLIQSGKPFRLAIVGDGPLRDETERQAAALGVSDRIDFLGRLPEGQTLQEIARSDILVLPSFMEGLPVVLMEACALGLPVVASGVAGVPELVRDEVNGLLFAPSDWEQLAEQLKRLIEDHELRQRLGRAGPERIAEEFDITLSAERLSRLFRSRGQSVATPSEHLSEQGRRT